MKKNILSIAVSVLIALCFSLSGCGTDKNKYGDPNANTTVPEGNLTLTITQDGTGNNLLAVGAECDPFFLSENVSRDYTGLGYECSESDWTEIFEPRISEMGIQFLRIMLLPSWYAIDESSYQNKTYTWDSLYMRSLYQVLDTAQKNDIDVNITIWLWDCNYYRLDDYNGESWNPEDWTLTTQGAGDTVFAEVFADGIDYLMNTKGYSCIKQITPINEPNSTFSYYYSTVKAVEAYVSLCKEIDSVFKEKGLRDKILFNLSDDARSKAWLSGT
ncbi:MAG: hypothetical protein WC900_07910, partial [Oscillospiraceae bacterium]